MVFVWTIPGNAVERENVEGTGIRDAGCDLARHIVAGIEYPASALNRKNLQ